MLITQSLAILANTYINTPTHHMNIKIFALFVVMKKYTHAHVYSWTRDRTVGVTSIFGAPAGRVKGNVPADVASRTCNSHSLAFSASFRSYNYY